MSALTLSPRQLREKRAAAHHLDPVVSIGASGVTPAVLREADLALSALGLIKVRVHGDDRAERERVSARLADALGAAPVQRIGKLIVLWRPVPARGDAPRVDRGAAPRVVKVVKWSRSGNHRPQIRTLTLLGNQRIAAGGTVKRAAKRRPPSPKKLAAS